MSAILLSMVQNCSLIYLIFITLPLLIIADYYETLGVSKTANDREIKKAFRALAVKYHPDKNKDPDAENQFINIAKAYEVLSDSEKRRHYDQFGESDSRNGEQDGGFQFNFNDFFKNFDDHFEGHKRTHRKAHQQAHQRAHQGAFGFNFDDIFSDSDDDGFFGSPFGGMEGFGGMDGFGFHQDFSSINFNQPSNGKNCKTTTIRNGNSVTTHTVCS